MPCVHDQCTVVVAPLTPIDVRPDQDVGPVSGHPSWCSPQHCVLDEYGERVHGQEPVCWEESGVRFESRLLFPDVEYPPATYLQLSIENLVLTWRFVDTFLSIAAVRALRDQLSSHLDAADNG